MTTVVVAPAVSVLTLLPATFVAKRRMRRLREARAATEALAVGADPAFWGRRSDMTVRVAITGYGLFGERIARSLRAVGVAAR